MTLATKCQHRSADSQKQRTYVFSIVFFQDLVKLYKHEELDPDKGPQQLQNKVQLDIRYYFCRRGGENVHGFRKDTFKIQYDAESKIAYVMKDLDELTKNHRENDSEKVTGFMPQLLNPDGTVHKMCPVRSFENYLGYLNPKIDNLWQQPLKETPSSNTWFRAIPLGHNPLDTFMSKLAEKCQLSQHYTNHCIRVTGVSNLMRSGQYSAKQVMSITGHKSIHSLAIYQRVRDDKKMMMGMSLTYSLTNAEEVYKFKMAQQLQQEEQEPQAAVLLPELPAPPPTTLQQIPQAIAPSTSTNQNMIPLENAVVPYQPNNQDPQNNDIDYLELLCDMEDDEENQALTLAAQQIEQELAQTTTKTSTTTSMMTKKSIASAPTFAGCKFGNIGTLNIHIHKH